MILISLAFMILYTLVPKASMWFYQLFSYLTYSQTNNIDYSIFCVPVYLCIAYFSLKTSFVFYTANNFKPMRLSISNIKLSK
jgi:hypothetical protein